MVEIEKTGGRKNQKLGGRKTFKTGGGRKIFQLGCRNKFETGKQEDIESGGSRNFFLKTFGKKKYENWWQEEIRKLVVGSWVAGNKVVFGRQIN